MSTGEKLTVIDPAPLQMLLVIHQHRVEVVPVTVPALRWPEPGVPKADWEVAKPKR